MLLKNRITLLMLILAYTTFSQVPDSARAVTGQSDTVKESFVPFVDQLANGEHYTIFIYSSGCFHTSGDTLVVKKENDFYFASWGGEFKLLDTEDINVIRQFETELPSKKDDGCTTLDKYLVTYKDEVVSVSDGSCSWNGGYYLKKALGW